MKRAWDWIASHRWMLLALLLLTLPFGIYLRMTPYGLWLGDYADYAQQRRGTLTNVFHDRITRIEDGYRVEYVSLESSSGLLVRLAIKQSRTPSGGKVLMLLGGLTRGRSAVDLLPAQEHLTIVGVDYPYYGDLRLRGLDYITQMRRLTRCLHDVTPSLLLAADYLGRRTDVTLEGMELVGVSLGAALVCVAGGLDMRFERVWSVQGGSDIPKLLDFACKDAIRWTLIRKPLVESVAFLLRHLEPAYFAGSIAPRTFVMVASRHDDRIPRPSILALFNSAHDPKQLIWLETKHVTAGRTQVIDTLVDTVLTRLQADRP